MFPRIGKIDFFLKTRIKVPKNGSTKWLLGKYDWVICTVHSQS